MKIDVTVISVGARPRAHDDNRLQGQPSQQQRDGNVHLHGRSTGSVATRVLTCQHYVRHLLSYLVALKDPHVFKVPMKIRYVENSTHIVSSHATGPTSSTVTLIDLTADSDSESEDND